MNERDEEIDVEERLLIGALDLPFEACAARIREAGGLCVPAHINRGSSGVLGALGFLPQGVHYDALEVSPAAPLTADDRVSAAPLVGRAQLWNRCWSGSSRWKLKDAQRGRGVWTRLRGGHSPIERFSSVLFQIILRDSPEGAHRRG